MNSEIFQKTSLHRPGIQNNTMSYPKQECNCITQEAAGPYKTYVFKFTKTEIYLTNWVIKYKYTILESLSPQIVSMQQLCKGKQFKDLPRKPFINLRISCHIQSFELLLWPNESTSSNFYIQSKAKKQTISF